MAPERASVFAVVLLVAAAATTATENASPTTGVHSEEFVAYMQLYGKAYCRPEAEYGNSLYVGCEESLKREQIYLENKRYIEEYNKQYFTHQLGINSFADLTSGEFKEKYLGYIPSDSAVGGNTIKMLREPEDPMPSSVDWRKDGLVTPIKNQGQCGACWAFAACAAIEGAYSKATSRLVSLSEQELVDCDTKAGGCSGGNFEQAFSWVIENKGIDGEIDYPYTAMDGQDCLPKKSKKAEAYIDGYVRVQSRNETQLQIAVSQQPVAIAIEADQKAFQFYRSGIFDSDCGTKTDHAVTIVGYGEDDMPYWILKNSWGPDWGEGGYMRAKRNVNQCGLSQMPAYPFLNSTKNAQN